MDFDVTVEIPKGHRNKYKYEDRINGFVLHGVLTPGAVFPFDFGFLPRTTGGDGAIVASEFFLHDPMHTIPNNNKCAGMYFTQLRVT